MNKKIYLPLKRIFDFAAALAGLIVLSPLLILLAALLRCKLGSPVVFKQDRPGLNSQIFTMYKFRTMTDVRNREGELLPDEERLPPFGRFLRSTSLDELPELINVLKGDMSLVGPRPLRTHYLPRYSPFQARRHEVRPGITGWAQINGRNAISWEEKFKLDIWYVDNISPKIDVKILFITLWKILKREGINQEGYSTVPEFMGQEKIKEADCNE